MFSFTSVLLTKSAEVEHPLSYLFGVVLRMRFEVLPLQTDVTDIKPRLAASDLVIVDATGEDSVPVGYLQSLIDARGSAKVIILQSSLSKIGAAALAAGADDVMVWPGNLHELALRCYLRLGLPLDGSLLNGANWSWEIGARIAEDANLSSAEAQILKILFDNFGKIVSRDDLSYALDDRAWRYGDRKFDVHIAKIRKKLSEAYFTDFLVETVRSEGYQLFSRSGSSGARRTG